MAQVQLGDRIRIHYDTKLDDGTSLGSTKGEDPIEIQTGKGLLFPKLEKELLGMNAGDSKTTTLPPEEAYGHYRSDLVAEIGLEEFTSRGIDPYEGLTLDVPTGEGKTVKATVTGVTDRHVRLDANHPCAGQSVTFSVQVVEIV